MFSEPTFWVLLPFAILGAATMSYWTIEGGRFLVAARLKPWLRCRQAAQGREGEWHPNMTSLEVFEYSLEAQRKKNLRFHQTHGANTRCLLCFKTPPPSSAPPSTPGLAWKSLPSGEVPRPPAQLENREVIGTRSAPTEPTGEDSR
ncbi:hypothetical protein LCGC14_0529170 [marine sediment metagenome]|uniref:Uncharacterized protein n=1 Tax=marine sediment metagenome TaxID=412755 RepID=A0A0F9V487_9ZZZZ